MLDNAIAFEKGIQSLINLPIALKSHFLEEIIFYKVCYL